MQCPKCLKEQSSTTQCDFCGIIFEKYQKRMGEGEIHVPPPKEEPSKGYKGLVWGAVACVACIVVLAWFFAPSKNRANHWRPLRSSDSSRTENKGNTDSGGIRNKLLASFPPKNKVEEARNATV